ncbi:hypothetical protein OE749_09620 [Aestuariibacter sp. AA17]|uniref:Uncharacterized protein n=1 Tax=Fluctibacter corallii TaxID=2984329 RepID=A0ABT3A8E1_9ALTE|nr:hypothetical protein [Aestuariibacter sp. AA17]MCV2884954.1 hypothetical protein [Aestuariibacter sp. AA17]
MFSFFRSKLTAEQQELLNTVQNSGAKVRVVGRGTVEVDQDSIINSKQYADAVKMAEQLVANKI